MIMPVCCFLQLNTSLLAVFTNVLVPSGCYVFCGIDNWHQLSVLGAGICETKTRSDVNNNSFNIVLNFFKLLPVLTHPFLTVCTELSFTCFGFCLFGFATLKWCCVICWLCHVQELLCDTVGQHDGVGIRVYDTEVSVEWVHILTRK